jgi:hypothetical protein
VRRVDHRADGVDVRREEAHVLPDVRGAAHARASPKMSICSRAPAAFTRCLKNCTTLRTLKGVVRRSARATYHRTRPGALAKRAPAHADPGAPPRGPDKCRRQGSRRRRIYCCD